MHNDIIKNEETQEKSKRQKSKEAKQGLLSTFLDSCNLWQNEQGEPFCDIRFGKETRSLAFKSSFLRAWITHVIYEQEHMVPEKEIVNGIHDLLEAKARLYGTRYSTFTRVCRRKNELFVDLGQNKMVRIDQNGWNVEVREGIKFIESGNMLPQVLPARGGSISLLRKYLNVSDDDFKTLVFWIVGSYASQDSQAILILNGPMDSGKSTTTEVIRSLIDPAPRPTDSPPKDEGDIAALAKNNFVLALDNLTFIPPWLSDTLCRISTGGGIGKARKLYTDNESASFKAIRPVILNGIPQFVEKSDLMSRCLLVPLQSVDVSKRAEWFHNITNVFPQEKNLILGAIFDILVHALRNEADSSMKDMPRLISFSKCCIGSEEALGWKGEFERLWNANSVLKSDEFIATNQLAQAIFSYFEDCREHNKALVLRGKLTEIKAQLIMVAATELPKSDKDFANKLMALRNDLLKRGIYMPPKPGRTKHGTLYELTVMEKDKL
tara:strand:+ start:1404 stop:2885 length:1482 start_codon:yes stop_codon:yes gene_type:complete